jgi:cell division protein FtsW
MAGTKRIGFDIPLAAATLALVIIGIVMVFSASGVEASEAYDQSYHYFLQQILGGVAGLVAVVFLVSIKKPFFEMPVFIYGLMGLTLALLVLCLAMPAVAKVNRWVVLPGFRFQPSELAKISLVLFFAHVCHVRKDRLNDPRAMAVPLAILFVTVFLVLIEPDFGTAAFLAALASLMLILGGFKFKYIVALALLGAAVFGFFLVKADYRLDRIEDLISGHKDPLRLSYQVTQSQLAIGSGGLLGASLGQSTQKLYLPQAHTDFIFAILGEETGLVGTFITLSLFFVMMWRGLRISMTAPNPTSRMIAAGLTFSLVAQALWNMTIVLGIGPTKGVPLPFISYGRSSLLCSLFAVGILLHISQKRTSAGTQVRI